MNTGDGYCIFVMLACMLTLVMPSAGQVPFAVFAFALAVLAACGGNTGDGSDRREHRDRYDTTGR